MATSIVTYSDLVGVVGRGLNAAPSLWTVSCSVGVETEAEAEAKAKAKAKAKGGDDGSHIDSIEYDFEEPDPADVWERCLFPVMESRYPPGVLHTFDLRPPVKEPLLVPMRRKHAIFLRLRLPGAGEPFFQRELRYGMYKWETSAQDDAHAPGWKDYFAEGRFTLLTHSELDSINMGNDEAVTSVVKEVEQSQRPHISIYVRRHVTPEQQRLLALAAKKPPGSPSPTFLKLQPEYMAVTRVVMTVDPLIFARTVVGKLLMDLHLAATNERISLVQQ